MDLDLGLNSGLVLGLGGSGLGLESGLRGCRLGSELVTTRQTNNRYEKTNRDKIRQDKTEATVTQALALILTLTQKIVFILILTLALILS